jgi:hypothetical protein
MRHLTLELQKLEERIAPEVVCDTDHDTADEHTGDTGDTHEDTGDTHEDTVDTHEDTGDTHEDTGDSHGSGDSQSHHSS